jgi:hypothetical protein
MAKYKPAGRKKKETPPSTRGLVPCAIIIIALLALISVLFYYALQAPPAPQ